MKHATICDTAFVKKIDYPGTGNYTQITYDGLSRYAKIVEYSAGTLVGTKQFVWARSVLAETRDASGSLISQNFGVGEIVSGANYYFTGDFLGSVRDATDSGGSLTQMAFDPFGRNTTFSSNGFLPDFQYAGYYFHARSELSLPLNRAYSAKLGRFINRDPIGEAKGVNLYAYVGNDPISSTDPTGLARNVNMNLVDFMNGRLRLGKTCLPPEVFVVSVHGWASIGKFGPSRDDAGSTYSPETLAQMIAQNKDYQTSKPCKCIVINSCQGAQGNPSICSLVAKALHHCVICAQENINTDLAGNSGIYLTDPDQLLPTWVKYSSSGAQLDQSNVLDNLLLTGG
jgi:RHS repeat-associated protein